MDRALETGRLSLSEAQTGGENHYQKKQKLPVPTIFHLMNS
jgi:hypothetical protein